MHFLFKQLIVVVEGWEHVSSYLFLFRQLLSLPFSFLEALWPSVLLYGFSYVSPTPLDHHTFAKDLYFIFSWFVLDL